MRAADLFRLRFETPGYTAEDFVVLRGPNLAKTTAKDLRPVNVKKQRGVVEFLPYLGRLNPTGRPVATWRNDGNNDGT